MLMSPTSPKPFLTSVPFRRLWHSPVQDVVASGPDKVIVLNFGKKIAEGPPGAIQANPLVIASYLGSSHPESGARMANTGVAY